PEGRALRRARSTPARSRPSACAPSRRARPARSRTAPAPRAGRAAPRARPAARRPAQPSLSADEPKAVAAVPDLPAEVCELTPHGVRQREVARGPSMLALLRKLDDLRRNLSLLGERP